VQTTRARLTVLFFAIVLAGCQPSPTASPQASGAALGSPPSSSGQHAAADPTSEDLIAAALAAGSITEEQSLLDRALALYDSPDLPAEFRSPVINLDAATDLFAEIDAKESTLSADLLAKLAPYRARPADPISIFNRPQAGSALTVVLAADTTPTWQSLPAAGGKARVWVKASPDAATQLQAFATAVTTVWEAFPDIFTYPDPDTAADPTPLVNPDQAIDFYFVDALDLDPRRPACEKDPALSDCVFGYVNDGYTQGAPPRHSVSTSAYLVVDATSKGDELTDTLAHELAHAGQFAYDRYETSWLKESTATWVAYRIMKKLGLYPNYEYGYLQQFFLGLHQPLTRLDNRNAYASWLYFQHAAMEEGPSIVTSIWESASAEGIQGQNAVDDVFAFDDHFVQFAVRNWNEHPVERQYVTADAKFPDGLQPRIRNAQQTLAGGQSDHLNPTLPSLASAYFDYSFEHSARQVVFTNALVGVPGAHVWAIKNVNGTWQRPEDWTNEATETFCRDTASEDLTRLIVIVSNSSMTAALGSAARPQVDALTDGCVQPSGPPTHIEGTISWDMQGDGWATTGTIKFIGKAFMGIGDYQVQPGSTYVDDHDADYCQHAHSAGVLQLWNTSNPPKAGVGWVGLVGGAGAPVNLFLLLDGDLQVCDGGAVPYEAAPACRSVPGVFDPGSGIYTFSCELQDGVSGTLHGTMTTSP
jgi:hypothetical protein